MTTAAIALEEQRAANASAEAEALAATAHSASGGAPLAVPVAAPAHAARSRLLVGAILVAETGWLAALGLFAYKLIT